MAVQVRVPFSPAVKSSSLLIVIAGTGKSEWKRECMVYKMQAGRGEGKEGGRGRGGGGGEEREEGEGEGEGEEREEGRGEEGEGEREGSRGREEHYNNRQLNPQVNVHTFNPHRYLVG